MKYSLQEALRELNNPKKNLQSEGSITKEQFRKMNIAQQSELFKTNPDLYKRLVAE